MAPPVHPDKLSHHFALIAIGHQACTQILLWWIGCHWHSKIYSKKNSRVQVWCPIELCQAKWGRAKSHTLKYKMWISKLPTYAALLCGTGIPSAPWCIARLYLYTGTQLHGILSWAGINRNGNRFFGAHIDDRKKTQTQIGIHSFFCCTHVKWFLYHTT